MQLFQDAFQELRDTEGTNPLGAAIVAAVVAALVAGSEQIQKTKFAPLYSSI